MDKKKGFWLLLLSATIYGTFSPITKFISQDLTGYQINIFVNALVVVLAILFAGVRKVDLTIRKNARKYVLLYGLFFGLAATCFITAILNTKIATAIFGIQTSSLVVSLLTGMFFFHEKFSLKKGMSILLAFIGLLFFTYPLSIASLEIGLLFGLGAGALGVGANAVGKQAMGKVDNQLLVIARAAGPMLFALALLFINNEPLMPNFSPFSGILTIIFAIEIVIVSNTALIGFKNFDLNLGSIVTSSELLFATLFAAIFFQEFPTGNELMGGLVILLAIIVANLPNSKNSNPSST